MYSIQTAILTRNSFSALLLFILCSSALMAQPQDQRGPARVYSVYDTDSDGYLDRREYEAFLEHRRQRHIARGRPSHSFRRPLEFSHIDTDKDQRISETELTEALGQRLRMRKRQGRERHHPPRH